MTQLACGEQPGSETTIGKVVGSSQQQLMAIFGLDLTESAEARSEHSAFSSGFYDAPGSRIAGGSDEIIRNVIAERVLGLPGDVRVDRDVTFRELVSKTG